VCNGPKTVESVASTTFHTVSEEVFSEVRDSNQRPTNRTKIIHMTDAQIIHMTDAAAAPKG
jgi:hypothetical protein